MSKPLIVSRIFRKSNVFIDLGVRLLNDDQLAHVLDTADVTWGGVHERSGLAAPIPGLV